MAERIWARDRLFRGLELDDLRSGDRRIVEDTAVAPIRQEFDPMIGGAGDRRVAPWVGTLLARAPTHGG